MTTEVSSGGKSSPEKIEEASPAVNAAFVIAFAAAFSRANATEDSLTSTPATRSNAPAEASAKSPLPQ